MAARRAEIEAKKQKLLDMRQARLDRQAAASSLSTNAPSTSSRRADVDDLISSILSGSASPASSSRPNTPSVASARINLAREERPSSRASEAGFETPGMRTPGISVDIGTSSRNEDQGSDQNG